MFYIPEKEKVESQEQLARYKNLEQRIRSSISYAKQNNDINKMFYIPNDTTEEKRVILEAQLAGYKQNAEESGRKLLYSTNPMVLESSTELNHDIVDSVQLDHIENLG